MAQSLPTGATVVSGKIAIGATSPTSLTVTQSSSTGIVNWSSFSVGQGNQVQFNNGSGATLNRVTGNVPSSINGLVSATGSVYLVNPSGVVVGPGGEVKTGGSFVASTLDVKDAEFRAGGSLTFSGNSNASVVNLGKIGSSKGDVVLIARQVRNDGSLIARDGTAAMASGSEVVLSDGSLGNGKVLVRRPAQDGEIRNSGAIRAAEVELRANGGNIYALAGNTGRAITATGVAGKGGRIFLTAEGGSVTVTQKVVARRLPANVAPARTRSPGLRNSFTGGDVVVSADRAVVGGTIAAKGSNGAGGTVVVAGKDVTLTSGARIDASGTSGGTVLIGGDRAGGSDAALKFLPQTIANAQTTTVEAGATIAADGKSGAGGNVVVWSDGTTSFAGAINTQGLRGGFIETSGHTFNFTGGSINAGKGGSWLLDPVDLTIDATLAGTIAATLNGGTDVTQQTTPSGSGGNGDITVASGISWLSNATLTLSAYRNIAVNSSIASSGGGGVVLRADNAGTGTGTVTFGGGQVSTAGTVSISYNPTGSNSTINATKYSAPTQTNFSGNVTGGATLNAYMLVNTVYDLQNMKNYLSGAYALVRDIDASATAAWNGGAGFAPVGVPGSEFHGSFDGQGHTISSLVINRPTVDYAALFGILGSGGTVSNVGLLGGSFTGRVAAAALVGGNYGTIANAYATAAVASTDTGAGGLVGFNYGSITRSHATGAVTAATSIAGGLVGFNDGDITQSYATGAVTAPALVGGLVGYSWGNVTQSYATGAVSGVNQVGGLIGQSEGNISQSYATGQVGGTTYVGGLVGYGWGNLTQSYATGAVSGVNEVGGLAGHYDGSITQSYAAGRVIGTSYVGGLVGSTSGNITQSYATGAVSGVSEVGGLVGHNDGYITESYATGQVNGTTNVGGLVGNNANGDTDSVLLSYWDSYSTAQAAGIGAGTAPSGLTAVTSDPTQSAAANYAFKKSAYGNFDFTDGNASTGWFMIDGQTRPFGQWEYSTNIANAHQLQLMAMDLGANYKLTSNIDFSGGLAVGGKYPGMWSSSGFSPIGDLSNQFAGSFDGQGRVISNLAIDRPSTDYVGLFGYAQTGAALSNVSLQAATIIGANRVGTLAGLSRGTVSNASATGTVTAGGQGGGLIGESQGSVSNSWAAVTVAGTTAASSSMGGLVGWNNGSGIIQDSYATGNVTAGTGSTRAGGLTAQNNGRILRSYATGAVSGGSQGVGGLVGFNSSGTPTIVDSYATGAVTATTFGGGLVGVNSVGASIDNSYATGAVSVASSTITTLFGGGLIGTNSGAVTRSYATGNVNVTSTYAAATATSAGGLIGSNGSTATLAQSYATGAASAISAAGTTTTGGLVGRNVSGGTVTQSYATGAASAISTAGAAMAGGLIGTHSGAGAVTQTYATGTASAVSTSSTAAAGGLIGSVTGAAPVTSSYWDTVTSGKANAVGSGASAGIVGLTTSQMQNPATYASSYVGWDFATNWSAPSVGYYPQLYGVNYVLRVDPASASRVYGEANPAFTYSIYGFHAGDTAAIVNGLSVSTLATAASNAGTYAISASGGSAVSASGQAYRFVDAPGTLTVTPRSISVTADAGSRIYGDANPALTYQVGGAGLVNGDTLSGALATAATAASNVGVYGITQGTLASPNYVVTAFTGANLTVTPRAITVTADGKSRAYGDANPALTWQVGGAGLVNGDTLSGALATSASAASQPGVYGITQGTLAASSNYAFAFVAANITVTPAAAPPVPRIPVTELDAYVQQNVTLPAPPPPGQMREPVSAEQTSPAGICKSRQCLELPHPRNRRIGERARFVDTTTHRDRLPAFALD